MTSVVTVCTGNICRSPAAQLLLARALGPDAVVTSAGTYAMVGHGITAPMLRCLEADGLDGREHVSRQLTLPMASSADLIVCMTARHRAWVLAEAPFAMKRTFLLSELAAAATAGAPLSGGAAGIAESVQAFRAQLGAEALADVRDPYMESQAVYDATYATMRSFVGDVAAWVLS